MRIAISSGSVLQVLADGPSRSLGVAVGPASTRISAPGLVQTAQRFRARSARNMDRGNVATRISWRSYYEFATAAESDRFFLTHARTLLRSGTLALLEEGNARATLYASAVIQEPSLEQIGQTVVVDYSAIAGPSLDVSGYWAGPSGSALLAAVGTNGAYTGQNVRLLNGTSDRCDIDLGAPVTAPMLGECTITWTGKFAAGDGHRVAFAFGNTAYRLYASVSGSVVDLRLNGSTTNLKALATGTMYQISVVFDASGQARALRVNGTTEWTGTIAAGAAYTGKQMILGACYVGSYGNFFDGVMAGFQIDAANPNYNVLMGMASGPSVVEYDRSGEGNNGAWTVADLAASATTDNAAPARNPSTGVSKYVHDTLAPIYVPYDIDGLPLASPTVPSGYTNSADLEPGVHNGCEVGITIGGVAYTLAQLQALRGYSALPIRNIYKLAAVQADTVADFLSASGADGVYFL